MIEERLRHQIVAPLLHRQQHLLQRMGAHEQGSAVARCRTIDERQAVGINALRLQTAAESIEESLATLVEQRRERRILIVPTPSPSRLQRVLYRTVDDDGPPQPRDASLTERTDESPKVGRGEERVEPRANAHDGVWHLQRERRGKLVVHPKRGEGSDGGDEFLTRCWTQILPMSRRKDHAVGSEVIDAQSELRVLQERIAEQEVESLAELQREGRGGKRSLGIPGISNCAVGLRCREFGDGRHGADGDGARRHLRRLRRHPTGYAEHHEAPRHQ